MQTINERLASLPDLLGYDSPAALAKAAGIDPNTMRKAMQGPSKPSYDTLEAITSRWPKLSPAWLLSGKGEPLTDGRSLAPALPAEPQRPAPLRTEPGQVDFVNKYISNLEGQLEAAADREAYYQARIQELLGKPSGNLYAAEPAADYVTTSAAPIGPRFDRAGVVALWPAGVPAEVTPLRRAN